MANLLTRYRRMTAYFQGLVINGDTVTGSDVATLASVTPGTAAASKALVVDSSINLAALNNLSMTGDLTIDGATGTGATAAALIKGTTPETTVVAGDQLLRATATAPLEASGTDAIALAGFWAFEAGDTFSATVNDTDFVLGLGVSEAATAKYRWSPVAYHPEANDGAALGLAATAWSDAYFADGAVVGFNNAYTITHTTALLTFSHAVTVTGITTPTGGVAAAGGFSVSPRLCHTGGVPAQISTEGTDLTVVVTELYVAEVFIPANCPVTGAAVLWGSATEGNAKVMLFDSAGTRLAISASTDVSGFATDSYGSRIPFASPVAAKGPATYYVGVIADNTGNRINTHILGQFGAGKIESLVYGTEAGYASITPPTTFATGLGPIASLY